MDIPLHVIRYFCVLADELHFGKAAAALSISAPSLSQQISRLERTIGAPLFERNPRKVTLTPAGLELLPYARRVRDDHDDLLRWADGVGSEPTGDLLRIGMVAAGAGPLTTAMLTSVVHAMPTVRLEMRRLGFFDTRDELLEGRVDVVFAPAPMELDDRIDAEPLWFESRVLVVPSSHPLAGRESISISEVADEVFVSASGGPPEILDWWVVDPRPDGSHPKRGPVADDFEGLLELVAAGVGVNIAAAAAAVLYRRDGLSFVTIRDIEPASILLCSLKRPATPAVHAFTAIARQLAPPVPRPTPHR
ncbi:MAG: LysR family transcriptional regulator [Pseudolysinimonas sp.]